MKLERRERPDSISAASSDVLCKIPVFRPVAVKLLRLLSNADVDIFEIVELLKSDPGFSAEFLTSANSAVYAVLSRVNTIERAVLMMGIAKTKVLVTRAALQGMIRGLEENVAIQNCWIHSRATASIAEWLAGYYRLHAERAYTVGLMHDIGRLGLLAAHSGRYAELLNRVTGSNSDLLDAERMLLTVDHCQAGEWLTRTWGLPKEFQAAAAHHHEPLEGSAGDQIDLVRMACSLALGFKAAPLIETESVEAILETIPDLPAPRSQFSLSDLSTHLQNELQVGPASVQ